MNDSKIVFDYIRRSSTIDSVANEQNESVAAVTAGILRFLKSHPESSYYDKISRKVKVELTKLFLSSKLPAKDFAEKYGLGETRFISLVGEVIDNSQLVTSDALADKLYRKLLYNRTSLGAYTPKRNIQIIAKVYVSSPYITQLEIAYSYNISRRSLASLLKRGIAEGILDHDLAEQVVFKSCYRRNRYMNYASSSYND